MSESSSPDPLFDGYAKEYDAALKHGISVSGESKEYFANGRCQWLAQRLDQIGERPENIMDFGCGTGTAAPYLLELSAAKSLLGVDVSSASIEIARQQFGSTRARFLTLKENEPDGRVDLAYCNGVFHHIPISERAGAVNYVYRSLRPGGVFAFWENNPWNPGTRIVMSRIPFDRDAITLTPPEARRLLRENGFEILKTDFLFLFPNALRWLRFLEKYLAPAPCGAQYMVLCRKKMS